MSDDYEKHVKPSIDNIFRQLKGAPAKPYLLKIQHAVIKDLDKEGHSTTSNEAVDLLVCSACRKIIDRTWDHHDWCELYEQEPLADWLEKGAK